MPKDRDPDATAAALQALHTRTLDALAGYQTMLPHAAPEFRTTVQSFVTLHTRHAANLAALVARHGGDPATDGSVMGTVNRAVVTVRAVFDSIDADTLVQIGRGEAHVLAAFDDALATRLPAAEDAQVRRMQRALDTLLVQSGAAAAASPD